MRPVSNLAFYLLLIESSLAIFENPFLIRSLFGKLFQIESKIREINVAIDDRNVQTLLEKVTTFRNEIDAASKVAGYVQDSKADGYLGYNKNQEKELVWSHLCSNPVHVFQLISISRLIVEEILPNFSEWPPYNDLVTQLNQVNWPDEVDFKGAIHGLLRAQYTYQLPIKELAKGKIRDKNTQARLSVEDCFFLATERINGNNPLLVSGGLDYAIAIEWAETALQLAQDGEDTGSFKIKEMENFLSHHKEMHDDYFIENPDLDYGPNLAGWEVVPNEQFLIRKFKDSPDMTARQLREEETEVFKQSVSSEAPDYHLHVRDYHRLCRGEKINYIEKKSFQGFCELRKNEDPWLFLAPAKAEIMSVGAFPVVVFHDVATEKEIAYMQREVRKQQLNRAGLFVASHDTQGADSSKFTPERTQSNAWLWEHQHKILNKLSRRLEHIIGLQVSNVEDIILASEAYQIGVYSPGGLYLPHYDSFEPLDWHAWTQNGTWVGNRIATAMFYLSDVEEGGGTVFPNQGIAVFPSKGSLLFWYNLKKSGRKADESLHGACPTLYGIKWVSNKWIREGSQLFKHPCSPDTNL